MQELSRGKSQSLWVSNWLLDQLRRAVNRPHYVVNTQTDVFLPDFNYEAD